MVRNVLGSLLALIGATAAVWSPFQAWYDGRHGRHYRLDELFSGAGITDARAELLGSLFLPFAFAALLTLVGVVLRSRLLVACAGVLVLGFTVLWMVRQGQAEGSLTVAGDGSGLGQGVLNGFGGGVFLLVGAVVMAGRGSRRTRRGSAPRSTVPTLDDPDWSPTPPAPGPGPTSGPTPGPGPDSTPGPGPDSTPGPGPGPAPDPPLGPGPAWQKPPSP
ncbi:hypothetical protein [Streptomyces sp. NPDC052114]|uniref:hypothetical protein n=1 Tax=unclassified Streptomyces TaxID=2593676 RepID=UPI00341AA10D